MKRILTLFSFFLVFGAAQAQVGITEAPDFELTDIHGESHNLYEILDAGQYVMIDLYAYWCGPCCTTAPAIKQVFEEYGCNTGGLYVIGLEADGTTAQTEQFEVSCGSADGHPVVSGLDGGASDIVDMYSPAAFPTIILVAPDRTIIEQDIWPFSASIADDIMDGLGIEKQECALVSSTEGVEEFVSDMRLSPSPFNERLLVQFELETQAQVQIDLINSLGQVVAEQPLMRLATGAHRIEFPGGNLAEGLYFTRITIDGEHMITRRAIKAN